MGYIESFKPNIVLSLCFFQRIYPMDEIELKLAIKVIYNLILILVFLNKIIKNYPLYIFITYKKDI